MAMHLKQKNIYVIMLTLSCSSSTLNNHKTVSCFFQRGWWRCELHWSILQRHKAMASIAFATKAAGKWQLFCLHFSYQLSACLRSKMQDFGRLYRNTSMPIA